MHKYAPLLTLVLLGSLPALSQAPATPNAATPPVVRPFFSLDASDRRPEYPAPLQGIEAKRWESWSNMRMGAAAMLGWKIGIQSDIFPKASFVDALSQIDGLALGTTEMASDQKFDVWIPKDIDAHLYPNEVHTILNKLVAINIEPVAYRVASLGDDEKSIGATLALAQSLKVTVVVTEKMPADLALVQKLAADAKLKVAVCGVPATVLSAVASYANVGVCGDTGTWLEDGLNPVDTVSQLKDKLFVLNIRDRSAMGKGGHDVVPGTGAAKMPAMLLAMYQGGIKPSFMTIAAGGDLRKSVEAFDELLRPEIVDYVKLESKRQAIKRNTTPEEEKAVMAALAQIPASAAVTPKKPRKLLVFDLNTPHGGHRSIPAGNLMIEQLGKKTGAWETVFSNDLENLKYPAIKQYDAVFLHNTVGLIFEDLDVRAGLVRFVKEGGGLGGNHGTSHADMDWPEFGEMLGARRGVHRQSNERDWIMITDPKSPITAPFKGQEFLGEDEYYRFPTPAFGYSLTKVHELLKIDVAKTDMAQAVVFVPGVDITRPDQDYAGAWIKPYGKGRVFYTPLGHNANLFFSAPMDQVFLNAIQYILGDLPADDSPTERGGKAEK
jgi:type 1 glutamine amidotransferase